MKTDRELIELAAKAAGLTVMWSEPFKRYERFVLGKIRWAVGSAQVMTVTRFD